MTRPIRSLLVLLLLAVAVPTGAQDRGRLARLLRGSDDFRVRVQAAFALGNTRDPHAVHVLSDALAHDDSPAVRAAAASALGRIGSRRALPALERARRDQASAVRLQARQSIDRIEHAAAPRAPRSHTRRSRRAYPPITVVPRADRVVWSRVRYVVGVGTMGNRTRFEGDALAEVLRREVRHRLEVLRGVLSFDADRGLEAEAAREIERRKLPRVRLEGNVVAVEPQHHGGTVAVRCKVSLMLLKEPDRTMQSMLSGAAVGKGPRHRDLRRQRRELAEQAVAAAAQSAMSGVPSALARAR